MATSATCSTTSIASTMSKLSPAAARSSAPDVAVIDRPDPIAPRGVAPPRYCYRRVSPPSTAAPSRARGSGKNAAAAADIENAQAGKAVEPGRIAVANSEAPAVANIGEPDRVELVQRRHRSAGVPPLPRDARKPRDLLIVDRRRAGWLWVDSGRFSGRSGQYCHHLDRMAFSNPFKLAPQLHRDRNAGLAAPGLSAPGALARHRDLSKPAWRGNALRRPPAHRRRR